MNRDDDMAHTSSLYEVLRSGSPRRGVVYSSSVGLTEDDQETARRLGLKLTTCWAGPGMTMWTIGEVQS